MAKTKKPNNVDKVDDNSKAAKNVDNGSKPVKNFNFKAHASHQPVGEMVTAALKAHAKADGVSLSTIRSFISKNFNNKKKIGKAQQEKIKEYIAGEIEQKKMLVENASDDDKINFHSSRFNMAAGK